MPLTPIPGFVGGSYFSRGSGASAARTINMRAEVNETPNPLSPASLFPRFGKKLFATLPGGGNIGAWQNKTRVFFVAGGQVTEVFEDGTFHVRGTVAVGSNPATMRANGTQLVICSAGNVYVDTGVAIYQPIVNYAKGFVDVSNFTVTLVSGDQFISVDGSVSVSPGDFFQIGANRYTVASVTDATHLALQQDAGVLSNVDYQVGTELLHGAMVEFIDGYFVVNVPNTKTFRISNLEDGTKWDALDFQTKNGSIDNIAAVLSFSGYLALVGDTDSVEIWTDTGNANFPFGRVSGQTMNCGTAAAWSVKKLTTGVAIWLLESDGGEHQVVMSNGGAPQRISNHAMENEISKYPLVFDAVASTYIEGGHEFYRLDFPTANRTWEYDATTQVWVELGVTTPQDEVYGCDPARYRVHVTWPSGKRMDLGGDFASGKIWQLSPDFIDDDGIEFPVMRVAPHINNFQDRVNCPTFALQCEMGTVDPTLRGPDGKELIPTVSLSYSDDGGKTWQEAGAGSLGRVGEYEGTELFEDPSEEFDTTVGSQTNPQVFEARPYWRGLGSFWISRTYKIKSGSRQLRAVFNGLAEISK